MSTMPAFETLKGSPLACPFFMPTLKFEEGAWLHPSRLPLGAGWRGQCFAPGHEGEEPSATELTEGCNLGYAVTCSRMPGERTSDAVRFSVARDFGSEISLRFVTEHAHLPVTHGLLTYDVSSQTMDTRSSRPSNSENGGVLPGLLPIAPNTERRYSNPSTSE